MENAFYTLFNRTGAVAAMFATIFRAKRIISLPENVVDQNVVDQNLQTTTSKHEMHV